jgi:outer membrane murein-binding lipoprotein Lpp
MKHINSLKSNIYYKLIIYLLDLIVIGSIIYITMNASNFKLCVGVDQTDIKNIYDINYLWILVAIIISKNIFMYYNKGTGDIVKRVMSTIVKAVLQILGGGLIFTSCSLYKLQMNNIDSVKLKFNTYLIRVWSKEDLKEYLLNEVLNRPYILQILKRLKLLLPLPEKLIEMLLNGCNTIKDVEVSIINFLNMLEEEKELLEKERTAGVYNSFRNYLYDLGAKVEMLDASWLLLGLVVCIGILFVISAGTGGVVSLVAEKTDTLSDKVNILSDKVAALSDNVPQVPQDVIPAVLTATEKVLENITKDVSGKIIPNITKEVSEKILSNITKEASEKVISDVVKEASEKVLSNITKEVSEEILSNVTKEISEKILSDVTKEASEKMLDNIIKEVSEKILSNVTKEASEKILSSVTKEVITEEISSKEKMSEFDNLLLKKIAGISNDVKESTKVVGNLRNEVGNLRKAVVCVGEGHNSLKSSHTSDIKYLTEDLDNLRKAVVSTSKEQFLKLNTETNSESLREMVKEIVKELMSK